MLFFKRKRRSISLKKLDKRDKQKNAKPKRHTFGKSNIAESKSPYRLATFSKQKKSRIQKQKTRLSDSLIAPSKLRNTKESKFKKILIIFFSIIIISGLIYFIFFTEYFAIKNFELIEEGTEITNNLEINQIIDQEISNKNLIFFDSSNLKQKILAESPEFQNIKISRIFPNKIKVEIDKYPQLANIIDIIESDNGMRVQKKYVVNTNGLIILENEENPELPYLQIITNQAPKIGEYAISQDKLDYIIKTINLFEEKIGIRIIDAIYLKKAREVHLRTEKGFTVWFDINYKNDSNNMVLQINKLKQAMQKFDIYNTKIDYIDLRISGTNAEKVIYKPK